MKITLQFLADKVGVSKSLVSKVLNDRDVRISLEKSKEIKQVARKYNYIPNRMASSLRTKSTNMIGLILPIIYFDFFSRIAYAVENRAAEDNYNLILFNTKEDSELEKKYLNVCQSGIVDGIIIAPTNNRDNYNILQTLNERDFPLVLIDRYIKGLDTSFVCTDGFYGGYTLTRQLIKKGHKNILFLGRENVEKLSAQIDRYMGYRMAMMHHGLKDQIINIPDNREETFKIICNLLQKSDKPTAIFMIASWDIGPVLDAANESGLVIPYDLEIATFDKVSIPYSTSKEIEIARNIKQPLLIAEQDTDQMGNKAVELLLSKINSSQEINSNIYIKPKFTGF